MSDDRHIFDCPRCDYVRSHRTGLGGAWIVFKHFYVRHPRFSFQCANPLSATEAPEGEEMILDDGGGS